MPIGLLKVVFCYATKSLAFYNYAHYGNERSVLSRVLIPYNKKCLWC